MEIEKNILTKEGLKELQDELKNLIEIERPKVSEEIKEARGRGDLSENAEFDAAREKQGVIEDRILEIESILDNYKLISGKSESNNVRLGSEVTLDFGKGEEETYQIVGTLESDPINHKISNVSPVGRAVINKRKGDLVNVEVESKGRVKEFQVKITNVVNN